MAASIPSTRNSRNGNIEKMKFNLRNMISIHKWIEKFDKDFVSNLTKPKMGDKNFESVSEAMCKF